MHPAVGNTRLQVLSDLAFHPFNFFTSRKWSYTTTGLTIRDHNAQALVQLVPAGSDRFEGKTSAGQDVVLSR